MQNELFQNIAGFATRIFDWIAVWIPGWLIGTALMLAAGGIALSVCRFLLRQLRHFTARFGLYPVLLLDRCQGPTCALMVLIALGAALPAAPFTGQISTLLGHLLLASFVAVVGWSVINTLNLGADLYMQRIHIEVEDNLIARKQATQIGILRGATQTLIGLVTLAAMLMTSASVRQYGVSLFASAGAAGLILGLAARPLLSNLLAGIQIAITQPIRVEDAVIVQGEFGWIERIASTYVVVRIWDLRRMILPLSYFIEQPFQNWTHQSADLLGSVFLYVDYSVPVDEVRRALQRIVEADDRWDGKVAGVQMTDLPTNMVELRILVSSRNAALLFDLRCAVREALVAWLYQTYPNALPRSRNEIAKLSNMPEIQNLRVREHAI
jgi:small-conductance mechanosensitive channel